MSLIARRWLLLGVSILAALGLVEGLLRLHQRFTTGSPGSVEELLARSASSQPAAEIRTRSLRGLVRPSADAELVYELKPGLRAVFKGRPLRVNSYGLRGREVTLEKETGSRRIVGLGDSVMFGWGVSEEASYLAQLERCLGGGDGVKAATVEVLNFAVPGYNTWMEVEAFVARGARFAPDLVVLHMNDNDLELPSFMLERQAGGENRLAIVRYVRRALGRQPAPPSLLSPPEIRRLPPRPGARVEERYRHMAGEAGVRRALARLAAAVKDLGDVPVIVLLLTEESESGRFFAAQARRHGMQVVTLGEAFSKALDDLGEEATAEAWRRAFWLSPKDSHPNALGHAVIAEALRRRVAARWGEERVCGTIPRPRGRVSMAPSARP